MEIDEKIKHLKANLEKIYPDMQAELPTDASPESVEKVKKIAAVASSNSMTLALYLRALTQYRKQKEAEITVNRSKPPKKSTLKPYVIVNYPKYTRTRNSVAVC